MTWLLVRVALRRDRVLLPAWLVVLVLTVMSSVTATRDLYPDEHALVSAADTVNATAALVAMYGKIYDPASIGAVSLIKMTAFGTTLVSMLFVFIAVRHTRTDEESGRLELVASAAAKRRTPLVSALIVTFGASVVLGVLVAVAIGAAGLPWSGAVAFGANWASAGIVYSALAAVAAQLTVSARAATGIGIAAVGLGYVLRAIGDLGSGDPSWISWLSPIGWSQQIRPFAGDRWWVVVIPLVAAAALTAAALVLQDRRDLGSGLIPERGGPARGRLGTPSGLAWRLHRGSLVAWLLGAAVMGAVLGSIAENVTGLFESPEMQRYLVLLGGKQSLIDAFLAAEVGIMGLIAAGYAVAAVGRLRSEEEAGHVELLLSTGASRIRVAQSHVVVALVGVAAILVAAGAAIGLTHGLAIHAVGSEVARLTGAGAGQIPAAWVLAGLALAVFGISVRAVPAMWGIFAAFIIVGEFGVLWELPDWVLQISPFEHSPMLPGGAVTWGSLAGLTIVALVLLGGGLAAWRRRDVTG